MNFKLTASLGVILLAIVISVLVATWRQSTPVVLNSNVLDPQPAGINSIRYAVRGGDTLAFEKRGQRWVMTSPIASEVNSRVADFAESLRKLTFTSKFTAEDSGAHSLEGTGLKAPRDVIEYTDDKGAAHKLAIGKRTSADESFANLDGGTTIFVLPSNPAADLRADANDFRDRSLVSIRNPDQTISRVIVNRDGQTVELLAQLPARNPKMGMDDSGAATWRINKPIPTRANLRDTRGIVSEFSHLSASEFTSLSRSIVGLTKPRLTVTAVIIGDFTGVGANLSAGAAGTAPATAAASAPSPAAPREVTIQFGEYADKPENKKIFAALAGSDEVYILPSSAFDAMNKSLDDLRDRHVIPEDVDLTSAEELTVTRGNEAVVFHSTPSLSQDSMQRAAWSFAYAGRNYVADGATVSAAFTALKNLSASEFPNVGDPASLGLSPPRRSVRIALPNGKTELLNIGEEVPSPTPGTPARTAVSRSTLGGGGGAGVSEPPVLVVSSTLKDILLAPLTARSRDVEALSSDDVHRIEITRRSSPTVTLTREGSKWLVMTAGAPAGVEADGSKITNLLAELTPVTAQSWLRVAPDKDLEKDAEITVRIFSNELPPAPAVTGPATATAPGTSTAPATAAATAIAPATTAASAATASQPQPGAAGFIGPVPMVEVVRTIHIYKLPAPARSATLPATTSTAPATIASTSTAPSTTPAVPPSPLWSAIIEPHGVQAATWVFEPTLSFVYDLTSTSYAASPKPATTSAPATATAPATAP